MQTAPLGDLLVVDLTQVVSGPVTTMLLAEFGARVIKIEPPGGEAYRKYGYPLNGSRGKTNLNFLRFSRGKESVELDLKTDGGREILSRLIKKADVLVENFRPGVMDRLGFGLGRLQELNPDLIYATISGYGHEDIVDSPYQDRPAYAIITEAMAGLMSLTADRDGRPVWIGFAMADIFAGCLAHAGILLALASGAREGRVRRVDISMHDGAMFMNDLALAYQSVVGEDMAPGQYMLQSPWGPFDAKDGHVVIAVLTDGQWSDLCRAINRPELADDAELKTGIDRSRNHEKLVRPAVEAWTKTRSREEIVSFLLARGVPASPVNSARDVIDSAQTRARKMMHQVESPELDDVIEVIGNPIKLNTYENPARGTIPALGQHTEQVLKDVLGASDIEITKWRKADSIR